MSKTAPDINFWSCGDDCEHLTHESLDEAVESYLDDFDLAMQPDVLDVLDVYGYRRMQARDSVLRQTPLDDLLEGLEEEWGDPAGRYNPKTEDMELAEREFLAVIATEYKPWACELVETVTINVSEWIRKNRADWLTAKAQ